MDQVIVDQLLKKRSLQEWNQLELVPSNLMIDGGGADTGGPNALPHGVSTWSEGKFNFVPKVRPVGKPWDNCYRYNILSRDPLQATYLACGLTFTVPNVAIVNSLTAFENEIEPSRDKLRYNLAYQWKPSLIDGPPAWRIFNQKLQKWESVPGLPVPVAMPGQWTSLVGLFQVDWVRRKTLHDSCIINGVTYSVGVEHDAVPIPPGWSGTPYFHNACQLDPKGNTGNPVGVIIKDWWVRAL